MSLLISFCCLTAKALIAASICSFFDGKVLGISFSFIVGKETDSKSDESTVTIELGAASDLGVGRSTSATEIAGSKVAWTDRSLVGVSDRVVLGKGILSEYWGSRFVWTSTFGISSTWSGSISIGFTQTRSV